jgi:hypothetical protein
MSLTALLFKLPNHVKSLTSFSIRAVCFCSCIPTAGGIGASSIGCMVGRSCWPSTFPDVSLAKARTRRDDARNLHHFE